jgi:phosphate transport system permease protein
MQWIEHLTQLDRIKKVFNWQFFETGDSREPELAGIAGAIVGSIMTIAICMLFSLPIGLLTALYLEEIAPKNWLSSIIEINVNNLSAIPSIIYGLLGFIIYLGIMDLPRSSALVGGATLTLMTLPIIIINTRIALRSIPRNIREAALAVGASKMQLIFHHLIPMAMPGIMTGTILSTSRVMGETAPLLLVGMVAFIADAPSSIMDPTSVIPVQTFLWADTPEIGFVEKTFATSIILIAVLIVLNSLAIILRHKFERNRPN